METSPYFILAASPNPKVFFGFSSLLAEKKSVFLFFLKHLPITNVLKNIPRTKYENVSNLRPFNHDYVSICSNDAVNNLLYIKGCAPMARGRKTRIHLIYGNEKAFIFNLHYISFF